MPAQPFFERLVQLFVDRLAHFLELLLIALLHLLDARVERAADAIQSGLVGIREVLELLGHALEVCLLRRRRRLGGDVDGVHTSLQGRRHLFTLSARGNARFFARRAKLVTNFPRLCTAPRAEHQDDHENSQNYVDDEGKIRHGTLQSGAILPRNSPRNKQGPAAAAHSSRTTVMTSEPS